MGHIQELDRRLTVACDEIKARLNAPAAPQIDPQVFAKANNQLRVLQAEKATMVTQFRTRLEQLESTLSPLKEAAEQLRDANRSLRAGQPCDENAELLTLRAERMATKAELDAAIALLKTLGAEVTDG